MAERKGKERIIGLQQQWKAQSLAYCFLLSLSITLLLMTVLHRWLQWSFGYGILLLAVLLGGALVLFPNWRITAPDIARYLNRTFPELEESCGLLLRPATELGPLEKWQAAIVESRLLPLPAPHPFRRKLLFALGFFVVACLFCAGIGKTGVRYGTPAAAGVVPRAAPAAETRVLGIGSIKVRIAPPAYTRRTVREQQTFSLQAEDGSLLSWQLETTMPVEDLQFIFNDTLKVSLHPENTAHTLWSWSARTMHSGFYQVKMGEKLSDLYKLEIIPDEAPHISIRTPKPYTVVDFGESRRIPLAVRLQDDYGIAGGQIVATIASGSGEAVKFKEQVLSFDGVFTGERTTYDLNKTLDLSAMGLRPGDELYFYIRAKDNHAQESRSDMYIISLPDTAQLMSIEGMAMAVDVKPEYFRSERQIILETEQLLREKDTMAAETFKDRSNGLGIDQKLLRLRYGKFLGEEAEEGSPGGHNEDVGGPGDFGNATKILDVYTDKHDNAEDGGFLEPAIKEQLKATLTEMWAAELRLRVFHPDSALPYEYKALRLLKDLQQKSRAYVAKTGVKVTPLNPAKRLAGELKDIGQPVQHPARDMEPSPEEGLRISLGLLDELGRRVEAAGGGRVAPGVPGVVTPISVTVLQQAERRLGKEAVAHPGEYLDAYQAMRRIVDGKMAAADILAARRALRQLLPEVEARPVIGKNPADAGLSKLYFKTLNGSREK